MVPSASETRFARLGHFRAVLAIVCILVGLAWCLVACLVSWTGAETFAQNGGDLQLYRRIIERVHSGERYYDAAGAELRQAGYPSHSPFNWRLPIYAWVMGGLPSLGWGRVLVCLGALAGIGLAYAVADRTGGKGRAAVAALLLAGAFLWCIDGDAFLAQELWSGLLILCSILMYALDRRYSGVLFGLAAVFFRELALPYCAIAVMFALWQRRWKEAGLWALGLSFYGLFLAYHAGEVARHVTGADRTAENWIQFGGAGFVVSTVQMNSYLFNLPSWVAALYLVASLVGLAAWRSEVGLRMLTTVAAYVTAFTIVGLPFNTYWGLMYAPLLPFGLVWVPAALRDLGRSIRAGLSPASLAALPASR
jgi:hypothetical protein